MNGKNKFLTGLLAIAAMGIFLASCDMTHVLDGSGKKSASEMSEQERDELERSGHFLKLTHMPLHTQVPNVASVSVAHSASAIAMLDKKDPVRIFRDKTASTVYLPLVYNNNSEFTETGSFYVSFTVHVDAITSFNIALSDKCLVPFADGRGEVDVRSLPTPGSGGSSLELTEAGRDELERSGHFLKLTHMPLHTQGPNVVSVSVANSAFAIAVLDKNDVVRIFREETTSTVYLPLVYSDDSEFTENGSFYVSFTVHVDAVTSFNLALTDKFLVPFTVGRGEVDVRTLPYKGTITAEHRYLTIYNLPPYLLAQNVSQVFLYNQNGPVAMCEDYNLIDVSSFAGTSTVRIPLSFINPKSLFTGTGSFYVAFDLFIDALSHFTINEDDRTLVSFVDGNGFLDILDIPERPRPYLTIKNLPLNTTKTQISNVSVFNMTASVAQCANYSQIVISQNPSSTTAIIPLNFEDTGNFIVTFTVNVDAFTRISFVRNDMLVLPFTKGSAFFDLEDSFGFFSGSLANPDDYEFPIIKMDTAFELQGFIYHVEDKDFSFTDVAPPSSTCFVYIYAYQIYGELFFEYSTSAPTYMHAKKGYYLGNSKRALFKMLYIKDVNKYVAKTYIGDDASKFEYFTVGSATVDAYPVYYTLSGSENPQPVTVTLPTGIYAVKLVGAGGGSGGPVMGTTFTGTASGVTLAARSNGGDGGLVCEIILVDSPTEFTAFTGGGGREGSASNFSGHPNYSSSGGHYFPGFSANDGFIRMTSGGGSGGGGGGSGTFIFSFDKSYLLCAAGGGGGGGGSSVVPGGGGGAGGIVGPGAGGGAAGYLQQSTNYFANPGVTFTIRGASGGSGGGWGASSGGRSTGTDNSEKAGKNASAVSANISGFANTSGWQGSSGSVTASFYPDYSNGTGSAGVSLTVYSHTFGRGGSGGSAVAIDYPSGGLGWLNTNTANATGGTAPVPPALPTYVGIGGIGNFPYRNPETGYTGTTSSTTMSATAGGAGTRGGNNRNGSRGGGSLGGTPAAPTGEAGSITFYKIF